MLKDILTPKIRKIVYLVYAMCGTLTGAIQVGFVAAAATQPVALTVVLAVYAYLGIGLGFTAAANVPPEKPSDSI